MAMPSGGMVAAVRSIGLTDGGRRERGGGDVRGSPSRLCFAPMPHAPLACIYSTPACATHCTRGGVTTVHLLEELCSDERH
jgi:hypothetical protein